MKKATYYLRRAAGTYYLVDTGQSGADYRPPVQLNEMGAEIVRMCGNGMTAEQMVVCLCKEYGISKERIEQDVSNFLHMLQKRGIEITDGKGAIRI